MKRQLLLFTYLLTLLAACTPDDVSLQAEEGEQYAGGENFTTFDFAANAFGVQGKNLSRDD